MTFIKYLTFTILTISIISCDNKNSKLSAVKIITNAKNQKISNSASLELKISNPNTIAIDSVIYTLNNKEIDSIENLKNYKLGEYSITAKIYTADEIYTKKSQLIILASQKPKVYTYEIINEYPHDITSYTQGLEFYNGFLYESTGQRGESKLRLVNFKTGEVLKNINLENRYFGEGLTVLKDKLYQLTWQSKVGFIYDVNSFTKIDTFKYGTSIEGWGICNDGTSLYKSDGSEKIWFINPETLKEETFIQAYTNKGKVIGLNELEWINGKIYANRYQKDGVAIINPKNGAIEGVIDFKNLKKKVKKHQGLDVLNGLAWNPETQTLFVTGKRWDKLFEVKIKEK